MLSHGDQKPRFAGRGTFVSKQKGLKLWEVIQFSSSARSARPFLCIWNQRQDSLLQVTRLTDYSELPIAHRFGNANLARYGGSTLWQFWPARPQNFFPHLTLYCGFALEHKQNELHHIPPGFATRFTPWRLIHLHSTTFWFLLFFWYPIPSLCSPQFFFYCIASFNFTGFLSNEKAWSTASMWALHNLTNNSNSK